jgi:low temperature requirement protein LtrA
MLFLIIALGEVIVATGITATELPVTASRLVALFVCFGIAVLLWWLYFDFHAEHTVRRFKAMPTEQGKLGRDLSYLFVPLVAGIIVCAVANELVIAHPDDELGTAELVALGAGPVIYLLGSVAFKIRVIGALWQPRAIAAAVTVGAVAFGSDLPAVAVWALVLGILIALAAVEARKTRDFVA